jgi:hypothetical protein
MTGFSVHAYFFKSSEILRQHIPFLTLRGRVKAASILPSILVQICFQLCKAMVVEFIRARGRGWCEGRRTRTQQC